MCWQLSEEASLFVGPCAFDVGRLLAQDLSSYYEHMLTEEDNDWHRQIMYLMIDAAKDTSALQHARFYVHSFTHNGIKIQN